MSFFPELDPPVEPPRPVRSDTPPWVNAPKTQLPVPVAVTEVLARRRGVALMLQRIDVYREGWYPLDDAEPDDPLLTQYPGGGGGSAEEYEQRVDAWLWPPPARDSLRLFYQWEGLGIAEAPITIDTAQLNIAREHVQIMWSE